MDVKELPARRYRLEREMREVMGSLINEFEGETGLGVATVEIEFMDVSSMVGKRAIISNVTVKLDIEP